MHTSSQTKFCFALKTCSLLVHIPGADLTSFLDHGYNFFPYNLTLNFVFCLSFTPFEASLKLMGLNIISKQWLLSFHL